MKKKMKKIFTALTFALTTIFSTALWAETCVQVNSNEQGNYVVGMEDGLGEIRDHSKNPSTLKTLGIILPVGGLAFVELQGYSWGATIMTGPFDGMTVSTAVGLVAGAGVILYFIGKKMENDRNVTAALLVEAYDLRQDSKGEVTQAVIESLGERGHSLSQEDIHAAVRNMNENGTLCKTYNIRPHNGPGFHSREVRQNTSFVSYKNIMEEMGI